MEEEQGIGKKTQPGDIKREDVGGGSTCCTQRENKRVRSCRLTAEKKKRLKKRKGWLVDDFKTVWMQPEIRHVKHV